jgi:hypothetical protein
MNLLVALLVMAAPHGGVTPHQFDQVTAGQTKHHVQRLFDATGHRLGLYYGPRGWAHLWKDYRTDDGNWAQVFYSHGPHQHVFRVAQHRSKGWCPTYRDPCTKGAS